MLLVLDLAGVGVFAISGALVAVRRRLDVIGVLVLATVTGLGGGWVRDVVIGAIPPAGFADWRYLTTAVVAGLVVFRFHPALARMNTPIKVFDAFGLGLFCVSGALKATEYGLGPMPAALLGVVTGVGGGMMRDVLAGQVPAVLSTGEFYAIPATIGAALTVIGAQTELPTELFAIPAAVITIVLRLGAVWRGWQAPLPRSSDDR